MLPEKELLPQQRKFQRKTQAPSSLVAIQTAHDDAVWCDPKADSEADKWKVESVPAYEVNNVLSFKNRGY